MFCCLLFEFRLFDNKKKTYKSFSSDNLSHMIWYYDLHIIYNFLLSYHTPIASWSCTLNRTGLTFRQLALTHGPFLINSPARKELKRSFIPCLIHKNLCKIIKIRKGKIYSFIVTIYICKAFSLQFSHLCSASIWTVFVLYLV